MKYYSTNDRNAVTTLREAVLQPLAPDGGLWMPKKIPGLTSGEIEEFRTMPFAQIALYLSRKLFQGDVPEETLEEIVQSAFDFEVPVISLTEKISVLELFHGPTLAFKDFGARFMSRLLSYFCQEGTESLTILVATSGDTGSAVAHGFYGVKGIHVVLLYPHARISEVQEKQMTTLGENVTAVEVEGTFDDCQRMVKTAFADADLRASLRLTSANSINIARLIPQSFYYFAAWAAQASAEPIVVSVPSGNMGNLTAGLIAYRMGFPVAKFVVATNVNDVVPAYLQTGVLETRESTKTISNAMDVGNPSNLARILDLYDHDLDRLRQDLYGAAFSDEETRTAISDLWKNYRYLCDPHGAVGYLGLSQYLNQTNSDLQGIFVATAHPAKFVDVVEESTGTQVPLPTSLRECIDREKQSVRLPNSFEELKSLLYSLRN